MEEIQRLEDRNRFLNNEIARLNTSAPTAEEKRKIEGNFEEIEKNKQIISELEENNYE